LRHKAQPQHFGPTVAEAAFLSPDGTLAISDNTFDELKLKNLRTGAEGALTGQKGSASLGCLSRDGNLLAALHYDDTLRLWHLGKRQAKKPFTLTLKETSSIALSPSGPLLATALGRRIILRETATGTEEGRLEVIGGASRLTFAAREELALLVSQGVGEVV